MLCSVILLCAVSSILQADATSMDSTENYPVLTGDVYMAAFVPTYKTYADGEELQILCGKSLPKYLDYLKEHTYLSSETVSLEYYNAQGVRLFQTIPRLTSEDIEFRSVLTANNDKYYLDCVIREVGKFGMEFRYRTTFSRKKQDLNLDAGHHVLILCVNGQDLTPISSGDEYDNYIFKYLDGEELNVSCRKTDSNMRGSLTLEQSSDIGTTPDRSLWDSLLLFQRILTFEDRTTRPFEEFTRVRGQSQVTLNVHSASIRSLTCGIDNSEVEKPNAKLSFVSDVPENDVRIQGLPRKNILYQYTYDSNHWTIEYQYSVNEAVELKCVAKGPVTQNNAIDLKWKFDGTYSKTSAFLSKTMAFISNRPFRKTLDVTHNGKSISCVYIPSGSKKQKKVEVILRLKPEANREEMISFKNQLILGSSIGGVFLFLGMAAGAWYYRTLVRNRNAKRPIETANGDPQAKSPEEGENHYESCYGETPTEHIYAIPMNVGNIGPEYHHYEQIDTYRCNHIKEKSSVYDEPYVHINVRYNYQLPKRIEPKSFY